MLFDYVLRFADSDLVLAQRLGEWVGHGPVLEEDIALTNVGLDLLGQARLWFVYAGEVEARFAGDGRSEDALAASSAICCWSSNPTATTPTPWPGSSISTSGISCCS